MTLKHSKFLWEEASTMLSLYFSFLRYKYDNSLEVESWGELYGQPIHLGLIERIAKD